MGDLVFHWTIPPSDSQILDRMVKWWQLDSHVSVQTWKKKPRVLVGVALDFAHRIIIGAVKIDQQQEWTDDGGYEVPTDKKPNLDLYGLRGRRISPHCKIKFNQLRSQQFVILYSGGQTVGGQR
jgi:hypothetical protein